MGTYNLPRLLHPNPSPAPAPDLQWNEEPPAFQSKGRQRAESLSNGHHAITSPDIPTNTPNTNHSAYSRDPSLPRGRALTSASGRGGSSSRSQTPAAPPSKLNSEGGGTLLERKVSGSYGHHRQTSIVHGNIQHSRNTSFATATPTTSPLSALTPQVIAELSGPGQHALDARMMAADGPGGTLASSHGYIGGAMGPPSNVGLKGHSPSTSFGQDTYRRPERMHSGRGSRAHNHTRSQSRSQYPQGQVMVSEYALHHLFNAFIGTAEQKINLCLSDIRGIEPRIETICGPGVDPAFDQLVAALGHIARQKPKPLIDSLMLWRKQKSEAANAAREQRNQGLKLLAAGANPVVETNAALHHKLIQLDRRSTISIFLLCRVLIEIFAVCTLVDVTSDMADRLEDIIYKQLSRAVPDDLEQSPFRQSNWIIFGQLLGAMSEIDFANVTARFLADLEAMQIHTAKEVDPRAVLVIRGMRWLRIKHEADTAWNQSCEFMTALAKYSIHASGQPVKYAFNNLFKELLLPLAANATTELNTPRWRGFIEILKPRLNHILTKPKHWNSIFPSLVVVICASPHEIFVQSWMSLIMPLQSKLKERSTRPTALRGICRLVWTYLYRIADTQSVAIRNLQEVVRLVFIPGRKSYVSTEPAIAEPLIQLVRIIGYKFQKFCFESIIFPSLMNSELFVGGKEPRMADLEPEKVVIGIRSFLAIMTDLEKGQPPPFPTSFESDPSLEPFQVSSTPLSPQGVTPHSTGSELSKEERLSRPVMIAGFGEVTKESYNKFCKILAEITMLCDKHFGGQAELDGRFAAPTPKTPMAEAFSFARREDHATPSDVRQGYYDLLHVAVQALPRCLSPHISFKSLINLLCTGTAHVQGNIASSSAQSLKAIARQSFAQQVTVGFARFIFNFEDRYSTMSDGGMLGPAHIESTLKLYIELLEIWIEEIKQKSKRVAPDMGDEALIIHRGAQLDLAGISAHVDEVESHGLFFLCSPACRVRTFAISVLRLVTEFDTALGKHNDRIIRIIEGSPEKIVDVNDEKLSIAEKSRLQRGIRASDLQSTLIELCGSDVAYDSALWLNVIFPNIIRLSYELCPFAVTLTRENVCGRISQMLKVVASLAEVQHGTQYTTLDHVVDQHGGGRFATTAPDLVVEQWKLYLIFACSTLTNKGPHHAASQSTSSQHIRKGSKSSQNGTEKSLTANELFAKVIPFMGVKNQKIREAVVTGLGSINHTLYKTLLECLQPAVVNGNEEAKLRMHQRSMSSPRRNQRSDLMRTEVAHVYKLTSHFLQGNAEAYKEEWILNNLVNYTKNIQLFLNDSEIQQEWEYNKLRTHFCGLMEELYQGIIKTQEPLRWMPFQSRKAAFSLMEDWCGYSPNEEAIRQRERRSVLDRENAYSNTRFLDASMEIEKRDLKAAALSALAILCAGPVKIINNGGVPLSFDVGRMVSWIDTIFSTPSDKTHATGRRALKNLILFNQDFSYFISRAIEMCYSAKTPKALESYFEVVTDVLMERHEFAPAFWKILCAGLYTLGNENNQLRIKSVRLLRSLEERQQKSSKLQDLDISISDKTIAVYKRAQFETSQRLAQQHPELAFHVFSEFSRHFKDLQPDHQRNIVAALLPWIQAIELQLDPNGGPTGASYMLLVNLFEITVKCGNALHNEIQALWQALANGPHAGNVQLVLDFIITLCLDRKEQNFVDYAKQIVVYLAGTPAGSKVVEFLQLQITPKAMVQEKEKLYSHTVPPDATGFPYLADLSIVLPGGSKQQGFSMGQLCLILLVDLMVAPMKLSKESVPLLLHVIFILWDHYIPLVQDQAREMLVHLMHELVISQIEDGMATTPTKRSIEDFIELVRQHNTKVVWVYEDYNGKKEDDSDIRLPPAMDFVATEVINIFSITYPTIREDCSKMALKWASICPVHHLACRSFQVFRSILGSLEQAMLADMLARLSNTIADELTEVQTFSLEILTTLKKIIDALAPADLIKYPQLFWTTCACLDTVHEREFVESLAMLERFMAKLDLGDPSVIMRLSETFPDNWSGSYDGLQSLIYRGVRSSVCLDQTLRVLEALVVIPSNDLVGDNSRFLFTLLANLPRFLRLFETPVKDLDTLASANTLANVAIRLGYNAMAAPLQQFAALRYAKDDDFLADLIPAVKAVYFPAQEYQILIFLLSLLTNKLSWFKIKTMHLLCVIIPEINMRNPEITNQGSDLMSPLLRLLQTEFCPQALAVLDNLMMTMTATPMDTKHLRMSMAGANTSRALRKEFDSVKSLYGIPEESGWSIPMPALHAKMTRENVHAVFYTCASPEIAVTANNETPKIELVAEEYGNEYFPDYRTATMMSDDTRQDPPSNMGDLVMKLDQLDDFFDDEEGTDEFMPGADVRESLYDQQTLPILHRSLKRNASVSSFQTGFGDFHNHGGASRMGTANSGSGDLRISPSREAMIMTPTAFGGFAPNQHPHSFSQQPSLGVTSGGTRPVLHSRSVTSPTNGPLGPTYQRGTFSTEEATLVDEPWEDEDFDPNGGPSHTESFPLENSLRPSVGVRFRSGIRRLTGGSADQKTKETIRQQLQKSPRVPKVPDIYVRDLKSAEI